MNKEIVEKLDRYFLKFRATSYKRRETLVVLATKPRGVFYLKEGFAKLITILPNGNELILNIYKHGSLFPMFWAVGEVTNNYAIETMTDCVIYKIPKKTAVSYLKRHHEVALDILRRILRGVDGLLTNYNHLLVGDADTRIAAALLVAAKRFGNKTKDGKILIELCLTHQDLANLSGMSRETASLAIEKLSREIIIEEKQKKYAILDMDRLYSKTNIFNKNISNPTIL